VRVAREPATKIRIVRVLVAVPLVKYHVAATDATTPRRTSAVGNLAKSGGAGFLQTVATRRECATGRGKSVVLMGVVRRSTIAVRINVASRLHTVDPMGGARSPQPHN
jgi:hypothetical protein